MGTRLGPQTDKTPKAMVEVAGKPFIFHQLTLLKGKGVSEIVLCVGNLGKQIEEYVGDGHEWGLGVQYSYDGDVLLGTGGALRKAAPKLPDAFFVMYGDSYLDVDLQPMLDRFEAEGKQALLTVYRNSGGSHRNNTLVRDGRIVMHSKRNPTTDMEYIDYGISILTKRVLDGWPDGPLDLSDVYGRLAVNGDMAAFEVTTRFHEVGSFQGIKETEQYLRLKGQ